MKKIVITNRKGGVGKTTTVFNLAWYFVQKGLKVLVVDTDGQQDLKKSFGVTNIKNTLGDYLLGRVNDFDPIIINDKLHFIGAGSDENVSNDMTALQNKTPMCFILLDKFLNIIADDYDIAIIDTAPALNLYTKSAIYTSDSVYIPMLAGTFEIDAIKTTINFVKNNGKEIKGIILTRKENTGLSQEIEKGLTKNYGKYMLNTKIRKNIALSEALALKESIFEFSPKSNGAIDYQALGNEISAREGIK